MLALSVDAVPLQDFDFARMAYLRSLVIESMGLFWLFAEIAILCAVLTARRHIEQGAGESAGELVLRFRRRLLAWSLLFLALPALVYGRHLFLTPAHVSLAERSLPDAELLRIFVRRGHEHLAVWSFFIAGWVALETLIVYHGWRSFTALRRRLKDEPA